MSDILCIKTTVCVATSFLITHTCGLHFQIDLTTISLTALNVRYIVYQNHSVCRHKLSDYPHMRPPFSDRLNHDLPHCFIWCLVLQMSTNQDQSFNNGCVERLSLNYDVDFSIYNNKVIKSYTACSLMSTPLTLIGVVQYLEVNYINFSLDDILGPSISSGYPFYLSMFLIVIKASLLPMQLVT